MHAKIFISAILLFSSMTMASAASTRSLCGLTDERTPSARRKVARLIIPNSLRQVCTASLVGKSCMISAGHCTKSMGVAQFNLGSDGNASAKDTYTINKGSLNYSSTSQGNDYAVFKVNKNSTTGKLPGDIQGYYKAKYDKPAIGAVVAIAGYGSSRDPKKNFRQQTHSGALSWIYQGMVSYKIDTENGNSGSGIVNDKTNEILGVHTNGGCSAYDGNNGGTLISGNPRFAKAIRDCLASE